MFHYIKGIVTDRLENGLVVETGGIGFEIAVPSGSRLYLAGPDEVVKVYTSMAVREDDISLYGFDDRESLQLFHMLTTVSGIGNKAAMAILSALSVREIRSAIVFEDAAMFTRAQGIGKKTASRIVLELKDKIDAADLGSSESETLPASSGDRMGDAGVLEDAIHALMALGYTRSESSAALKSAGKDCSTAEEYIKEALKQLSRF